MLHSVVEKREDTAVPGIAIDSDFLEQTLAEFRRLGYSFARVSEIPGLLAHRGERFVAFTLDDGYRDNLHTALPIFRAYNAPAAVYATVGFVDSASGLDPQPGSWHKEHLQIGMAAIDHLTRLGNSVSVGEVTLPTRTYTERVFAATKIPTLVSSLGDSEWQRYETLLDSHGTSLSTALKSAYLTWNELRTLASDSLVEIGGHTLSHRSLSGLSRSEAEHEIGDARQRLERELHVGVRSIAYPFGSRSNAAEREFELAKATGYDVGFTTVRANLHGDHAKVLLQLPRLGLSLAPHSRSLAFVRGVARGGQHAVLNRLRRFVF